MNNILTKTVTGSKIRKMHPESNLCRALFRDVPQGECNERVVILQVMYCSDACIFVEYIECE